MALCWNITLQSCGAESNCAECCDTVQACVAYSVTPITGALNDLQVGDRLHLNIGCDPERPALDGFFHDCPQSLLSAI